MLEFYRQFVALSFVEFKVLPCDCHYLRRLSILSFQAEISNNIYSNVYLKVKQVCLRQFSGRDFQCCRLTHWIYGKSLIFQLWASSSTISSRSNCCFSSECTRSNWCKKHKNVSRKTYNFPKVKLRQSLKKSWTKINMIFVQRTLQTVLIK